MPKPNAAAERAERMVQALRQQRDQGGAAYPLTLTQLVALVDPQAAPEQALKDLGKKPFVTQVVLAQKKDPASPIALAEDAERLAGSPLLLEFALGRVCTEDQPLHPVKKVVAQVDRPLRDSFQAALERHLTEGTLPPVAGSRTVKNKVQLYLQRLPPPPPPPPPPIQLADKLVRVLESQRDLGEGSYPLPLHKLFELTDPGAKKPLRREALTHEPFQSQAVVAVPDEEDSPVALAVDRELLAGTPALLEYLLEQTTSPRRALAPLARLQEVLTESLRQPFAEAVRRHLAEHTLPPGIDVAEGVAGPELILKKHIPPAQALALKMLRTLQTLRQHGQDYPLTMGQLQQRADPGAGPDLLPKAAGEKVFKPFVLLAWGRVSPDTPVVLTGDEDRLVSSPLLLEFVLASARTYDDQAVELGALSKKVVKAIHKPFETLVRSQVETGSLPPGVGCLRIRKKPHLFLLQDLEVGPASRRAGPPPAPGLRPGGPGVPPGGAPPLDGPAEKPPAAPPLPQEGAAPPDFQRLFEEAFDRLDREEGSHNFVNLVDLRRSLPFERTTFDAALHELRSAGRFTLSGAEGRHGISPEEQEAGIREGGSLLLFVSRKTP